MPPIRVRAYPRDMTRAHTAASICGINNISDGVIHATCHYGRVRAYIYAHMRATSNAQGELSPLERGVHVFNSKISVRDYAKQVGGVNW